MQLRRRKLGCVPVEGEPAAKPAVRRMNPPSFGSGAELSIRRAASERPPQQQEGFGSGGQSFLYRTASDGSPLYFPSAADNSMASSASRLSPDAILSMQQTPKQAETALTKSWSDPQMAYTSEPEPPNAQVTGPGGFCASSVSMPPITISSGFSKLPKIEEGLQQSPQMASDQGTDSATAQAPEGELMNEFSRALVENLSRDNEEEPDRLPPRGRIAREEEEFLTEDQGSPKAPSRRGPRGTSSKYRGVTRHRHVS